MTSNPTWSSIQTSLQLHVGNHYLCKLCSVCAAPQLEQYHFEAIAEPLDSVGEVCGMTLSILARFEMCFALSQSRMNTCKLIQLKNHTTLSLLTDVIPLMDGGSPSHHLRNDEVVLCKAQ